MFGLNIKQIPRY